MSLPPILLAIVGDSAAGKSTLGRASLRCSVKSRHRRHDGRLSQAQSQGSSRAALERSPSRLRRSRSARRASRSARERKVRGEGAVQSLHGRLRSAAHSRAFRIPDRRRSARPPSPLLCARYECERVSRHPRAAAAQVESRARHFEARLLRDAGARAARATRVVSEKYICPQREHADMVVRFHPDSDHTDYEHLHATVTMRPNARSARFARRDRIVSTRSVCAAARAQ